MSEQKDILQAAADKIVKDLQDAIPKVTGKTAAGIFSEVTENSINIFGPSYIFALEFGRGPTGSGASPGNPSLFDAIKEWALAKGVVPDESKESISILWAITKSIHKYGTQLYRSGVPSGVLSNVVNNVSTFELLENVSSLKLIDLVNEVEQEFSRLGRAA